MDNQLQRIYHFTFHWKVFFLLFTALLLSSCTHVARQDGPPNFYVDETKIPNAVPKAEPLAKYGNMQSYRVFGKRYFTLKSNRNYDEIGTASWYGTKFHAQRTSSGERYNMLAMTAAHKSLPLPTYVEVTNLKNHRQIIVKVNDRGPFEGNRLIDLSYVAAKKLGMLGHGTALVRVKSIDPLKYGRNTLDKPVYTRDFYLTQNAVKTPAPHPTYYASSHLGRHHPHLYLQVGAFKNKLLAEQQKRRLIAMITSSPIKVTPPTDQKKLYRVQIGPIKDVATAQHITARLKAAGLNTHTIQSPTEV